MTIPCTIHRIWLDDPMPDEFAEYGRRFRELHPRWMVNDWRSSATLPKLVNRDLFDRAQEVCPRDWKRFQSDLLRLELLWLYGGVYVDTDVEPLKPFDDLLDPPGGAFAAWSANTNRHGRPITQAVLAAAPQHPFIGASIDRLPDAADRYRGQSLAQMIGPWHITRVYRAMKDPQLTVHPPELFYPQSNAVRDRGEPANIYGAYAHHKWANTRDNRHGGVPR
jgi:mannosyltransferase OCH1-like enzyme